jgi:predicted hotdog family 3-hydroxylacyl-ACP dehydratase
MSQTTHDVPIDVERIRELVPHAGKMCLLERVVDCDTASIRCETRSHLDRANPLRRNGHLSSVCAIEYAAQAMALHGALMAPRHSGALMAPRHSGALTAPGHNGALMAPGDNGALTAPEHSGALTAPKHNGAPTAPELSGALNATAPSGATGGVRRGYLASVRDMRCHTHYLDEYTAELIVSAKLMFEESSRMIYSFTVTAGETELVTGRAAVILA